MDLVKPWLVALAVWFVGIVVSTAAMLGWATASQLESTLGGAAWVIIPQLVIYGVAASLASFVHTRSDRGRERNRNAIASLGMLAIVWVFDLVLSIVMRIDTDALLERVIAGIIGALLGWLIAYGIRRRRERLTAPRHGYF